MPSQPRRALGTDEAVYHVLNRGHDRADIFFDDDDRLAFLRLLARYRRRFGFHLLHYCLMSNHYHLLVQLRNPRDLSALGAGWQRAYVHHLARRHRFVGHLFQGRFKSVVVQQETHALSCGRYIERNPVAAGLVEEAWGYRWSSAAYYALGTADPLVDKSVPYTDLSPRRPRRQQLWREFLVSEDPKEDDIRRAEWVIGDEAFRRRMRQVHGRPVGRRRGRPPQGSGRKMATQDSLNE